MTHTNFKTGKFSVEPTRYSKRLLQVTLEKQVIEEFLQEIEKYPVQALEYKSFI